MSITDTKKTGAHNPPLTHQLQILVKLKNKIEQALKEAPNQKLHLTQEALCNSLEGHYNDLSQVYDQLFQQSEQKLREAERQKQEAEQRQQEESERREEAEQRRAVLERKREVLQSLERKREETARQVARLEHEKTQLLAQ